MKQARRNSVRTNIALTSVCAVLVAASRINQTVATLLMPIAVAVFCTACAVAFGWHRKATLLPVGAFAEVLGCGIVIALPIEQTDVPEVFMSNQEYNRYFLLDMLKVAGFAGLGAITGCLTAAGVRSLFAGHIPLTTRSSSA